MGKWKKWVGSSEEDLSVRDKAKVMIWRLIILIISGMLFAGIGVGIGLLIAGHYDHNVQDVLFMEGVVFAIIGILTSMKGNPSGVGTSGWGIKNANAVNYVNLETTVMEREITDYYKNFRKNAIVEYAFGRMTLILAGVILAAIGILFF